MNGLEDYWNEAALMSHLGITKLQMEALRERGIPMVRVTSRMRIYRGEEVAAWLEAQRRKGDADYRERSDAIKEQHRRAKEAVA